MSRLISFVRQILFFQGGMAALAVLAILVVAQIMMPFRGTTIEMEIGSRFDATAVLYYDTGQGFSAKHVTKAHLYPGGRVYLFSIPTQDIRGLRLVVTQANAVLSLSAMRLRYNNQEAGWIPANRYVGSELNPYVARLEGNRWVFHGYSATPLTFDVAAQLPPPPPAVPQAQPWLAMFLVLLLGWCLLRRIPADGSESSALPVLQYGCLALGLALAMAYVSASGDLVHPDETHHYVAAKYYFDHWLRPPIGHIDTLASYSNYGVSYLYELDIVYLLAGKFAVAVMPLAGSELLALRLFNVSLFAALLGWAYGCQGRMLLLAPLLLVPQTWYVFSYFNGDAFPLFLSLILVGEILLPRPERLAEKATIGLSLRSVLVMGVTLGLLLASKRNYWIVPTFLLLARAALSLHLSWRMAVQFAVGTGLGMLGSAVFIISPVAAIKSLAVATVALGGLLVLGGIYASRKNMQDWLRDNAQMVKSIAGVVVLGLAIFVVRLAERSLVEGEAGVQVMAGMLARYASPELNPTLGWASYFQKGVPLAEMLSDNGGHWMAMTQSSFFGVYGYMTLYSPRELVDGMSLTLLAFVVSTVVLGMVQGRLQLPLVLIGLVFAATSIFLSIAQSWFGDFQPQGRYLFPILPVLGLFVAKGLANRRAPLPVLFLFSLGFLLAVVSFVRVGLVEISKIS